MIDLYYWPTPNGWKVSIMLEECGFDYRVHPININKGDQFSADFLKLSPNNRMPVIVDHDCAGGPLSVFESGAILVHLAERAGRFMPKDEAGYKETLEWMFWHAGNLSPMAGQYSHFRNYAPDQEVYARRRYSDEFNRCLGILENRLKDREFMLGDYSIVDMACWPWVLIAPRMGQPLDEFPSVLRWRQAIKERPAARAGVDLLKEKRRSGSPTEDERDVLFNQTARSVQARAVSVRHHRDLTGKKL